LRTLPRGARLAMAQARKLKGGVPVLELSPYEIDRAAPREQRRRRERVATEGGEA